MFLKKNGGNIHKHFILHQLPQSHIFSGWEVPILNSVGMVGTKMDYGWFGPFIALQIYFKSKQPLPSLFGGSYTEQQVSFCSCETGFQPKTLPTFPSKFIFFSYLFQFLYVI